MANEKRLIDANAFKIYLEEIRQEMLEENTMSSDFAAEVIETVQDEYLQNAPTVDAVEVKHGRWEKQDWKGVSIKGFMVCSNCNVMIPAADNNRYCLLKLNYCPNCGAKMDGDGNG
jgi:hypothetical protein